MILFKKIDDNGIWIETMSLEHHPTVAVEGYQVLDSHYIADYIPNNIYSKMGVCPKWDGTKWIENVQRPEPTTPQLSTDEKITQMAEQLVIAQTELEDAQTALDFLLMGGF